MVTARQEPSADRVLKDRLAAEIKRLIGGRSVEEAVCLLTFLNLMLNQIETPDERR